MLKRQQHRKTKTKEYGLWKAAKDRCFSVSCKHYHNYGGRGITMQKDWVHNFLGFYNHITSLENYNRKEINDKGLTLDRIDNDLGYEEGNLRWAKRDTQQRNRRIFKNNKSGYRGVYFNKNEQKYRATISVDKYQRTLGHHETAKGAYQLRVDYIKEHNLKGFEIEFNN